MKQGKIAPVIALLVCLGCSSSEPIETRQAGAMDDTQHAHYHLHAVDVSHEHEHLESDNGGHTHDHAHAIVVEDSESEPSN